MVAMTDALTDPDVEDAEETPGKKERKSRKRSIEEGRITTLGKPALGRCIKELANDCGIMPTTFTRMLIVEALKERGYPMSRIDKEFGELADPADTGERE